MGVTACASNGTMTFKAKNILLRSQVNYSKMILQGANEWKVVAMCKSLVKLNVLVELNWYGKLLCSYKDTRWKVHVTTNNIVHCKELTTNWQVGDVEQLQHTVIVQVPLLGTDFTSRKIESYIQPYRALERDTTRHAWHSSLQKLL